MLNVKKIEEVLKQHQNRDNALKQSAYLKELFPFFGLSHPLRREVQKPLFKLPISSEKELIELVDALWEKKEREFHYVAQELLYHHRKLWSCDIFSLLERMIRSQSWWDTVDFIAANLLGTALQRFPEKISMMDTWIRDSFFWIRRSALLFQLKWKEKTDETRLFQYCTLTLAEKEFFIRKAIGWVLREYSKSRPEQVRHFVDAHQNVLSGLSFREATKYL